MRSTGLLDTFPRTSSRVPEQLSMGNTKEVRLGAVRSSSRCRVQGGLRGIVLSRWDVSVNCLANILEAVCLKVAPN